MQHPSDGAARNVRRNADRTVIADRKRCAVAAPLSPLSAPDFPIVEFDFGKATLKGDATKEIEKVDCRASIKRSQIDDHVAARS